jgi:carbon monoxide dehydrogenase subunit G
MDMTGEERIGASRQAVWAALNDIDVLKQCIPGCQSLERQSDTDMTATVKLQIGPVSATFSGKVKLSDLDPPNGYRIAGEGSGGAAGYAKGGAVVRLVEDVSGTLLRYEAKADVGGKLAQLGGRLIDATARKLAGEFFHKFGSVVGQPAAEAVPAPPARPARKEGWLRRCLGWLRRWFGGTDRASGGPNPST